MLKVIQKLKSWLLKALEATVITVMGLLVVVVIWQVFTRYVLNNPSSWTEEFATFLLMWISLLGASVAFMRGGHLGMDYFFNKLPDKPKAYVEIFSYVLVAFFAAGVLMFGGAKLISLTLRTSQPSPAMGLEMGLVYLALPISGFFILIFAVETTIEKVSALFNKRESTDDVKQIKREAE